MGSRETLKNSWRKAQRVVKNQYNSYGDAQVAIRDATSNSSSIPSREQLAAVARLCDSEYDAIAPILWRRLVDYKFRRHVLKALIVIDYLLLRAGEQFMADVVERIDIIRRLKLFKFFKNGAEVGYEVREQAAKVMGMLENFDDLTSKRLHLKGSGRRLDNPDTGYIFEEEHEGRLALGAPPAPLRLEYNYDNFGQSREEANAPSPVQQHSDDEEERQHEEEGHVEEEEEEKPKKKKGGKKLKKKKAKKPVQEEGDEDEGELTQANKSQSTLDDFLLDLMVPAAAPAKEQALVPASSIWETTDRAADNQLGWLGSSTTAPITDNELALFDTAAPVAPAPSRARSVQEPVLFDFGPAPVARAPAAAPAMPMHYQPYGTAPAMYGYHNQAPAANYHQSQWNMSQQQLSLEYHPQPAHKQDDVFSWMN
eukprot:TRINITY_DN11170_c0_g2_i1.p1 TRINITY_DN11170_c0_g2~~TRINITY_DN11170_c0_g2_i1.p1  ORF type:complete len:425 (+),score=157.04 TRINITY_DN11170_c0_g2_i1:135-1409(+)